jgi:2'-5' RNA ligase
VKRLFFALWPDDKTRRAIQEATRTLVQHCAGRPVPPENFHVTLAFLGQQPGDLLDDITAVARDILVGDLELGLDKLGYWPKPRVVWLGPSGKSPALDSLAASLWAGLEGLGVAPDERALYPHITLCRKARRPPPLNLSRTLVWRADHFVLVQSVTAERGAQYTVLEQFPDSSPDDPYHR